MGNNQTLYQQVKKTWFDKAQKECKRLNITLKKDKSHKTNFIELHSIQEADQTVFEKQVIKMLSKPVGVLQQILDFRDSINFKTTAQAQDIIVLQLIDIYTNVMILYYGLDQIRQPSFLTKNTLRTLATQQIFDEKLYYTLYGTRRDEQQQQNERLHDRIRCTSLWTFEDFGIPVKYFLNDTTREYLKLGDSRHKLISSISTLGDSDLYAPLNIECIDSEQIPNRPSHIANLSQLKEDNPYQAAVNALNQIQIVEDPITKLKSLMECFDCIFQAITEYYKGFAVKPSNPSTDDLIKIFNYILSRSSLQNPLTHHDLMFKYCINAVGVGAYQLTVMQASLNFI